MSKTYIGSILSALLLVAAQTAAAVDALPVPAQAKAVPAVAPAAVGSTVSSTAGAAAGSTIGAVAATPTVAPSTSIGVPTEQGVTAKIEQPAPKKKRPLPGVGTLKVNTKLTRGSVVRTTGDGTETVMISKRFPNRLATPFSKPRVIDNTNVRMHTDGSSIFISATNDEPFVIFVTGSSNSDPVISLTLIPKDIPAQIISLQIDSAQGASRKGARVEGYTQQIIDLMRTVASGKSPDGYSEGLMPNIVARQEQNGLIIIPVSRFSGANLDIYKYRVENSLQDIELSETSFYQDGVRAVSIHPNTILRKGEATYVYVLADKSVLDGDKNVR